MATSIAVFLMLVAAVEASLRALGATPSAGLTPARWAAQFERALASPDPFTTVLLGSSQIGSGFSSETFHRRYPNTPLFYLVTVGDSPYALFLYLAHQTDFRGRVIVSLNEGYLEDDRLEDQRDVLEYYEDEWGTARRIDYFIDDLLGRLAFRQSRFSLDNIMIGLLRGEGLPIALDWRRNRRTGESDYWFDLADPEQVARRRSRFDGPQLRADAAKWRANFARLDEAVAAIQRRGGQVALVKWPLSASWASANARRYPRSEFWQPIVTSGHAVAVDAAEIPGVHSFARPDGNHLDASDKDAFTDLLLDWLEAAGMHFAADR